MSQHFIGDPVEDVENEKAQGKDSSGYGVDPFGSVHKTLVQDLSIVHSDGRGRCEHCGPFHSGAVLGLEAVTESVTSEVKTTTFPHKFLLLLSQAQTKRLVYCCHTIQIREIYKWVWDVKTQNSNLTRENTFAEKPKQKTPRKTLGITTKTVLFLPIWFT